MTAMGNPWDDFGVEKPTARAPRSLETRENSQRRKSWVEPTILPEPHPRDGLTFKWVRTGSRGTADKTNYQKRIREGWEPVDAADYPELKVELGLDEEKVGHIEVGGLILCSMPTEMVEQRREYYRRRTAQEVESADQNFMRDSDERMKKFTEHQRRVVFGR